MTRDCVFCGEKDSMYTCCLSDNQAHNCHMCAKCYKANYIVTSCGVAPINNKVNYLLCPSCNSQIDKIMWTDNDTLYYLNSAYHFITRMNELKNI